MINQQTIDELKALNVAASLAPWHVTTINDDHAMSAVAVTKNPSTGRKYDAFPEWIAEDIVAACLIQAGGKVSVDDARWHDNANLIAAMRNALPDLLRLAEIGLKTGQQT